MMQRKYNRVSVPLGLAAAVLITTMRITRRLCRVKLLLSRATECPLWVINGHNSPFASCPLTPDSGLYVGAGRMG